MAMLSEETVLDDGLGVTTIYDLAKGCDSLFDIYLEALSMTLSRRQTDTYRSIFQDHQERFWAWASGLGVYAEPFISLDRRLANHPKVQELVAIPLELIRVNLLEAVESCRTPEFNSPTASNLERIVTSPSGSPVESGIKVVEGPTPAAERDRITGFSSSPVTTQDSWDERQSVASVGIEGALRRLNRLSNAIRQSRETSLAERVQRHVEKHEFEDTEFKHLADSILSKLYPDASDGLKQQLLESIIFRRSSVVLQQNRQQRLNRQRKETNTMEEKTDEPPQEKYIPPRTETMLSSLPLPKDRQTRQQSSEQPNAAKSIASTSSSNKPTTLDSRRLSFELKAPQPQADCKTSVMSTAWAGRFQYPPAPVDTGKQALFSECPICLRPYERSSFQDKRWWRRHVDNDLQIYPCISQDCRSPPQYFSSHSKWIGHMQSIHSHDWLKNVHRPTGWSCTMDDCCQLFGSQQQFDEHVKTDHARQFNAFSKDEFSMFNESSCVTYPRKKDVCPLCQMSSKDLPAALDCNTTAKIHEEDSENSEYTPRVTMDDHIAEHLMYTAKISFFGMSFWPDETSEGASMGPERHLSAISQHSGNLPGLFSTTLSFDSNPNSDIEETDYGPEESFEFLKGNETVASNSVAGEENVPNAEIAVSKFDEGDQEDGQKTAIPKLITHLDFSRQHTRNLEMVREGTRKEFFQREEFQTWLHDEKHMLFCPGLPGSGKTILTSMIIEYLKQHAARERNLTMGVGIAYVFCDWRLEDEQNCREMLASILQQLLLSQKYLPESHHATTSLKRRLQDTDEALSTTEVADHISAITSMLDKVYILIDGIDECPRNKEDRHALISSIMSLRKVCQFSLFVTSRYIPEFNSYFKEAEVIPIIPSREDVTLCARDTLKRLGESSGSTWPRITEFADQGSFLFRARRLDLSPMLPDNSLALGRLRDLNLVSEITYFRETYDGIMSRASRQPLRERRLAEVVLQWLSISREEVLVPQLLDAAAILGISPVDRLIAIDAILFACQGVVEVDKERNVFSFSLKTIGKCFRLTLPALSSEAEENMARICIRCLTLGIIVWKSFWDSPEVEEHLLEESFRAKIRNGPLHQYALRHWGYHARKAGTMPDTIMAFLNSKKAIEDVFEALWTSGHYRCPLWARECNFRPRQVTGLHLAAYYGVTGSILDHFAEKLRLIPLGRDVRFRDEGEPFRHFLGGGDVNVKDSIGWSPLSYATFSDTLEPMERLLAVPGIDADCMDSCGRTPFSYAAEEEEEVGFLIKMDLLLRKGRVNPDSKDHNLRTPLSYAAAWGRERIVEHLLAMSRVNPDSVDKFGRTPFSYAAEHGHQVLLPLLLEKRVKVDSKDQHRRTPLSHAAGAGSVTEARFLVEECAANLRSKDQEGKTPLYYAAASGHEAMVKLLLYKKASETCLDIKDESGKRPLDIALEKHGAEHSVTKFLSEKMAQNEEARTRSFPGVRRLRGIMDRFTNTGNNLERNQKPS